MSPSASACRLSGSSAHVADLDEVPGALGRDDVVLIAVDKENRLGVRRRVASRFRKGGDETFTPAIVGERAVAVDAKEIVADEKRVIYVEPAVVVGIERVETARVRLAAEEKPAHGDHVGEGDDAVLVEVAADERGLANGSVAPGRDGSAR